MCHIEINLTKDFKPAINWFFYHLIADDYDVFFVLRSKGTMSFYRSFYFYHKEVKEFKAQLIIRGTFL